MGMPFRQLDPRLSVSIVFVTALFMSIMDGTIVNVALPSMQRQLAIPNASRMVRRSLGYQTGLLALAGTFYYRIGFLWYSK